MESEYERLQKKVENYPSASSYNRLAELARLAGDDQSAKDICRRCIKEFPRNGQAYVILAEMALTDGHPDEALQHLQNAVERDSRSYSAHRMLADLHESGRNLKLALHHLRQILSFRPNDPAVTQRIDQLSKKDGGGSASSGANSKPPAATSQSTASRPAVPAATEASSKRAPSNRDLALAGLVGEPGVRGAVIVDRNGRVVFNHGLPDSQAEVLAALTAEISTSGQSVVKFLGQDPLTAWVVEAELGQVLAFKRDSAITLAVLADVTVRAALLELRARQALLDLGVA